MTTLDARPVVLLSALLKQPVLDPAGKERGRLVDVIVALRGTDYPPVIGFVVHTGSRDLFVPAAVVAKLGADGIVLAAQLPEGPAFERRDGEVLLRADVLGHRLIDVSRARLVRAYDVALSSEPSGTWAVAGVDVHRGAIWHLPGRHQAHPHHDWAGFEALIGHAASARQRASFGRLRKLKAAQIADLLETADRGEQAEILDQVHEDPELEADVFEELDDDQQSRLLASRADPEVADVLSRMRADDAADALLDLPQERRRRILDTLPPEQARKVTTLLGYNETTAGGLMGVELVAVRPEGTVADAIAAVRAARTDQPEALVTVYLTDGDGMLRGAVGLITLLQAEAGTPLHELADQEPVHVHPDADVIDVVTAMSDFNLLTLPVLDQDGRLIGLITVDDVLEIVVPDNWRRRDRGPRPTVARGEGGVSGRPGA